MNQGRPGTCRDCGVNILTVRADGLHHPLEDHDLPITTEPTDPDVRFRLWQNHGPRLGWLPQYAAVRTWRPMRVRHICAHRMDKHLATVARVTTRHQEKEQEQ